MKVKTFSGGYKLKRFQGQPQDKIIECSLPSKVSIPMSQGFGSDLLPSVKVGDKVSRGQIIACDDNKTSSPIHSSVNGVVTAIEKKNYFKRELTMVTITTGADDGCPKLEGATVRWDKLPNKKIEELLYKSGVSSLDREGIPTSFKTSIIGPEAVEDLIIHGVGSEAYNTSLDILLAGRNLYNFIEGIKILMKIMPKAKVHLALNKEKKKILERIKKLTTKFTNFSIYPVVPKYPQGYDEVLVPTLLGKRFPYGYSAANIGIVVLNIQAVLKVFEAVGQGKPLIERIVSLCGPSFKENIHIKVRVGTSLEHLLKDRLKDGPCRIILNSLFTGVNLNNLSLPVNRTYSQIIAIPESSQRHFLAFARAGMHTDSFSRTFLSAATTKKKIPNTNMRGDERPCIQCGYCSEVCPVAIMPTVIDRYIKLGINENLLRYGIFNCIECNLCSYVCPSKVLLGQHLKEAKIKLIEIGCDQSLCIVPRFDLKGLDEYKGVKKLR